MRAELISDSSILGVAYKNLTSYLPGGGGVLPGISPLNYGKWNETYISPESEWRAAVRSYMVNEELKFIAQESDFRPTLCMLKNAHQGSFVL